MRVGTRESKATQKLEPKARYRHFVKEVVGTTQAWGLFRDGWALAREDGGQVCFPLWAERELAERCAKGPWQGYEAAEIPLDDLVEQLLPQLARDGLTPALSPTPEERGVAAPIAQLILDLEHERDPNWSDDQD